MVSRLVRRVLVVVAAIGLTCGPSALSGASEGAIRVGQNVWVDVSVATLWTSSTASRPVDAKAVSAPVDMRGWLAAMSTSARRDLVGRVETQALYGDRLIVTGVRSGWLHVVAVGQPTHRDPRGYPGWVPARQVTTDAPETSPSVATVTRLTTWLRGSGGRRLLEVSIGTRLPVLAVDGGSIAVATPSHGRVYVASAAVVVRRPSAPALARSASGVLSTARQFIGRPYLWGGRSGFAVDCSGFTELTYKLHGVVIPRDTDDQARAGRSVPRSALQPGDLLFFREGSTIGHVGFYVGGGKMLHAPHTGANVQTAPMGSPTLARRFV